MVFENAKKKKKDKKDKKDRKSKKGDAGAIALQKLMYPGGGRRFYSILNTTPRQQLNSYVLRVITGHRGSWRVSIPSLRVGVSWVSEFWGRAG